MENLQRVGLLFFIQTVNQTSLKVLNRYDCSLLNQLPSASLKMSLVVVVQSLSSVRLLQPCGLQPTRLFCPWDFPGKNTRMDCHFLLQGIFQTQELNLGLLHCRRTPVLQADSLPPEPDGKPHKCLCHDTKPSGCVIHFMSLNAKYYSVSERYLIILERGEMITLTIYNNLKTLPFLSGYLPFFFIDQITFICLTFDQINEFGNPASLIKFLV